MKRLLGGMVGASLIMALIPAEALGETTVGGEVPGCAALQLITDSGSCEDAASAVGLEPEDLENTLAALALTADVRDFDLKADVTDGVVPDDAIPENCDIRWLETCLPPLTQQPATPSGNGQFGTADDLRYVGTRDCAGEGTEAGIIGKSHRYEPRNPPNTNKKWRVWTQWHDGYPTTGDSLLAVGSMIRIGNGELHDASPIGFEEVSSPQQFGFGVQAYGFGISGNWTAEPDREGGAVRGNYSHYYLSWSGVSDFDKSIRGASMFWVPKRHQGVFSIGCAAVTEN